MSDLVVELYGKPIGRLVGSTATYDFVAAAEAVDTFGLDSTPVGGKTSLAGVQDKIVLVRNDDGWHRALDGYPSARSSSPRPTTSSHSGICRTTASWRSRSTAATGMRAITRANLVAEVASWRLRDAEALVDDVLADIAEILEREDPADGAHPGLVEDIRVFTANLRAGRSAGAELSGSRGE